MKLVIGLGNPGSIYQNNRHNVGFMVLDQIVSMVGANGRSPLQPGKWRQRVGANVFEIIINDEKHLLVVPQKFMNNSGQVVSDLMNYYNLESEDIIVISDDLNIDFGTIRIRKSGGNGGHNGLKNIIEHIGGDFWRIRIGIKNEQVKSPEDWHDFVLSNFSLSESKKLVKILDLVASFVLSYLELGQIEEKTLQITEEALKKRVITSTII